MKILAIGENCKAKDLACSINNEKINVPYFFGNGFWKNLTDNNYSRIHMLNMFLKDYMDKSISENDINIIDNTKNSDFIDICYKDICYVRHIQHFRNNLNYCYLMNQIDNYFKLQPDNIMYYYDSNIKEDDDEILLMYDNIKKLFNNDITLYIISNNKHILNTKNIITIQTKKQIEYKDCKHIMDEFDYFNIQKIFDCKLNNLFAY